VSRNTRPEGIAQLGGYLYEVELRDRGARGYAMSGHVRVGGIDYQVRCYLEYFRGTSRKRWRVRLKPMVTGR